VSVQLRSVRLKNFRSFEEATLPLGPGTTLLWGDVGAGKTSVLYAIEMALFGFAEVEPTYLIRHRATTAEVELALCDGPHEYVFSRRFHRRLRRNREVFELDEKGTGLSTDGRMVLYPSTELRQRAIDLLGFPDNPNPRAHSDLWRWAVYVPQERMRQILESEDADARLETVRKALGLEKYRTAAENAAIIARELKREAGQRAEEAGLLAHWEGDLDHARRATDEGSVAVAESMASEGAARTEVVELEALVARVEEDRRRLEGDRRELEELGRRLSADRASFDGIGERIAAGTRRLEQLEREAIDLEKAASRLPEAERAAAEIATERRRLAAAAERAEEERRELDQAEATARSALEREAMAEAALERGHAEQQAAVDRFEELKGSGPSHAPAVPTDRTLTAIEQDLNEATTDCERRAGEVRHLQAARDDAARLVDQGICPTCGQAVSPEAFGSHRAEVEAALAAARDGLDKANARRQAITAERGARERYERARDRWLEAERAREVGRDGLARADAETARRAADRASAKVALEAARRRRAELEPRAAALQEARERVRLAESEGERREKVVADLRAHAEAGRSRRESAAGERMRLEELRRESAAVQARVSELADRSARLSAAVRDAARVDEADASAKARRTEARRRLEEAVGRHHRADAERRAAVALVEQAEIHVAERRAVLAEGARLKEISAFLAGPFRDGLLELEHHLLSKAKAEFDRSFGRYFALLIEDPSLVARSDPRFSPSVEIDGEDTPPEALSGGERTALALAYRLALGRVVRTVDRLRLDTLILDEPTDGFSPEQVQRMGELLGELDIPQVLLVSHEALLNGVADRVVRVRKVEGVSELAEEAQGAAPAPAAPPAG
jgi:exonuclease SbcC